jgi:hypothetical protein
MNDKTRRRRAAAGQENSLAKQPRSKPPSRRGMGATAGSFKPGDPRINRAGRPRPGLAFAERVRERVDPDMVIDLAIAVAEDESTPLGHRLAALWQLIDRGYGSDLVRLGQLFLALRPNAPSEIVVTPLRASGTGSTEETVRAQIEARRDFWEATYGEASVLVSGRDAALLLHAGARTGDARR